MTPKIYQALIKAAEDGIIRCNSCTTARLKLVLCLFTIIGIQINELLSLEVHQLKNLLAKSWIKVDRSRRGLVSHKVYL